MSNRTRAVITALPLAIAASLGLTGCASPTGAGPAPGMDHGAHAPSPSSATTADQMFVVMMIPHHEQAIEMSDLLLGKADIDPGVAELAERITAAQGPEIEMMQAWLDDWAVAQVSPGPGGMDHGDGMMSQTDMAQLRDAEGAEASRLFLEQMIVHHQGAVEMAEAELAQGRDAEVRDLARRVVDDQTAEITEMRDILARL